MHAHRGHPTWLESDLPTPAMVFGENELRGAVRAIQGSASTLSADLLYSIKACSVSEVVKIIAEEVRGLSCSSLYEARFARETLDHLGSVHMTSPALSEANIAALGSYCDFLSFNSLSQLDRLASTLSSNVERGLRINPDMSFVPDKRYDPCRRNSKLGVPIKHLSEALADSPERLAAVSGVLIHSNCDSRDLSQLEAVARELETMLPQLLEQVAWVNLGGGYLLDDPKHIDSLADALDRLRSSFGVRILLEPGSAFVRGAGFLICEVVDVVSSGGGSIAVVNASINHLPEVFEYQFEPDVVGHCERAENRYTLAGSTCLAGDIFGEYAFAEELKIGSRIVFENVGAYTTTKSNMFNGIPLPTIFLARLDNTLELLNECTYDDFRSRL